jgi:hypothetical protein
MLFFLAGGAAWFSFAILFTNYEHLAVPVAAALAAIGGFILIINAFLNPDSIQRPDIQPPQINITPNIGGYRNMNTGLDAKVPGIINVNEWFIVNLFQKDKPLTRRQRIRGTFCCLLWMATVAIYLPVSFHMDNFEISWLMFLGAAVIHCMLYGLLSIGERKETQI